MDGNWMSISDYLSLDWSSQVVDTGGGQLLSSEDRWFNEFITAKQRGLMSNQFHQYPAETSLFKCLTFCTSCTKLTKGLKNVYIHIGAHQSIYVHVL